MPDSVTWAQAAEAGCERELAFDGGVPGPGASSEAGVDEVCFLPITVEHQTPVGSSMVRRRNRMSLRSRDSVRTPH